MPRSEAEQERRDNNPSERIAELEQKLANQQSLIDQLLKNCPTVSSPECVLETNGIKIVTGSSNPDLARKVGAILRNKIDDKAVTVFSDRSPHVQLTDNVREQDVFVLQSTAPPDIPRATLELLLMLDAAKRASARKITAVVPYNGFARGDKKDESRVPIANALMWKLIKTAGANRALELDPHSGQSQGFFDNPLEFLYSNRILLPVVEAALQGEDFVSVAPDAGAGKMAERITHIAQHAVDVGGIYKVRPKPGEAKMVGFMGNVRGKNAVITDESTDTFGSLNNAAQELHRQGARQIYAMIGHGLFSDVPERGIYPLELLSASPLERVFITDTIAHREEVLNHPKITVVSVAPLIAEGIRRMHKGESLSEMILK